ncbi:HDOD domain-containing protein [Candidatus Sumerlaeota bacterium]|nr:HDOD domain-containing protein [Candidatus Sumerlaeota bacterium]
MPKVVELALEACENPNSTVRDVSRIMRLDEAITIKLIHLANSPYYKTSRAVDSVEQAMVMLGLKTVTNLMLTLVTGDYFRSAQENYRLQRGELWKHSVAVAVASQLLGERLHINNTERLFTVGLLHDIGKIILDKVMGNYIATIREYMREHSYSYFSAEAHVLGITHADVGAELIRVWELPEFLQNVIQHHHHPLLTECDRVEAIIVHLADNMSNSTGIGVGENPLPLSMQIEAMEEVGLTVERLERVTPDFIIRFKEAAALVNVVK